MNENKVASPDVGSTKLEPPPESGFSANESSTNPGGGQTLRKPSIETDYMEFGDGTQIELIEDPEDSSRTLFAVFERREIRLTDRFEYENRSFVPVPRSNPIRYVRLPRGVGRCCVMRDILDKAVSILSKCLDLNPNDIYLLAHFAISTWFIERLPVAPYVALVGPPGSGKSTALAVLSLLCRRSFLTADITSPAFYRICERLTPTLLIDETGSAGERKALFHLLRIGTTHDLVALRTNESFKTFGPKVISWIELPNDRALNSRCVVISLHETRRTDLLRPKSPEIREAAEDLQKQLLRARFFWLKTPLSSDCDGKLSSRTRDLYQALALPFASLTSSQWLIEYLQGQEASYREPLPSVQSSVLRTLFKLTHDSDHGGNSRTKDLAAEVNRDLLAAGENRQVSPREVGSVLTSLGFGNCRKRTNAGYVLRMGTYEIKRIHDLIAANAVEGCVGLLGEPSARVCESCRSVGLSKG